MGKHAKRITINNENGDLVILGKYTERVKYSTGTQNKIAIACIRCYCGNVFETQMKHIMSRNTKSCGCYRRLVASKNSMKHGMAYTNTYSSWENFMKCVNNKNSQIKSTQLILQRKQPIHQLLQPMLLYKQKV